MKDKFRNQVDSGDKDDEDVDQFPNMPSPKTMTKDDEIEEVVGPPSPTLHRISTYDSIDRRSSMGSASRTRTRTDSALLYAEAMRSITE